MQKDTRKLTSGLKKCKITAKNPPETGTETRQPSYCSLCPPPPWRDMQPLCHVKEIISKAVWVKCHISSGSCQFQGKLNKVRSYPDRKRKAISRGMGRGSCIILVLLRLFFTENMTLVCGVTILALHKAMGPVQKRGSSQFVMNSSGWIQCSKFNLTVKRKETHYSEFYFESWYRRC